MRELDACHFCGADPDGTYELLPPRLDPSPSEQRVLPLCAGCSGRLDDLLAPFLARLDGSTPDAGDAGDSAGSGAGEGAAESPAGAGEGAAETSDGGGAQGPAGSGADDGGSSVGDGPGETDAGGLFDAGSDAGEGAPAAGRDDSDDGPDPEPADGDGRSEPANARQVLRLLQNREFPVDRAEFQAVAAGAYDLAESDVAAVLDEAAERGLVTVEDGRIRRS